MHETEYERTLGAAEGTWPSERAVVDFDALIVRLSFIDARKSRAADPVERTHEYWCQALAIMDATPGLSQDQLDRLVGHYIDGLAEGVCGIVSSDPVARDVSAEHGDIPEMVLMATGAIGRRHGGVVRAICLADEAARRAVAQTWPHEQVS